MTFHSNARFSGNDITTIALFHSGVYDLTLKLNHTGDKTYVKIY